MEPSGFCDFRMFVVLSSLFIVVEFLRKMCTRVGIGSTTSGYDLHAIAISFFSGVSLRLGRARGERSTSIAYCLIFHMFTRRFSFPRDGFSRFPLHFGQNARRLQDVSGILICFDIAEPSNINFLQQNLSQNGTITFPRPILFSTG